MLSSNTNRSNQCVMIIVFAARIRACGGRCVGGGLRRPRCCYVSGQVLDRFQCIVGREF